MAASAMAAMSERWSNPNSGTQRLYSMPLRRGARSRQRAVGKALDILNREDEDDHHSDDSDDDSDEDEVAPGSSLIVRYRTPE